MYSNFIINLGKKRVSGKIIDEALFALQSLLEKYFPEKYWYVYRDDMYCPTDYELIPRTAELESRLQCCVYLTDLATRGSYVVFIQSINPKSYYYEIGMRVASKEDGVGVESFLPILSENPLWGEAAEICRMVGGQLFLAIKLVQA